MKDKKEAATPKWGGEVYNCYFKGKGSEQSGWRPAVIFQNNIGNVHSPNVIVLPMTGKIKRTDIPTHVIVRAEDTGLRQDSMVICENPEAVSKDRLGIYITKLSKEYMAQIAVANLLATSALELLEQELIQKVKQETKSLCQASWHHNQ